MGGRALARGAPLSSSTPTCKCARSASSAARCRSALSAASADAARNASKPPRREVSRRPARWTVSVQTAFKKSRAWDTTSRVPGRATRKSSSQRTAWRSRWLVGCRGSGARVGGRARPWHPPPTLSPLPSHLVQQQDVGLGEEGLGEGDPHAPAAGEGRRRAERRGVVEPQAVEDLGGPRRRPRGVDGL